MDFLRRLFGGGGGGFETFEGEPAHYAYVRPRGCTEVVQLRVNLARELNRQDEGGYVARKVAAGSHRCFNRAEVALYFDDEKRFVNADISGGELVSRDDYAAWQATLNAPADPPPTDETPA